MEERLRNDLLCLVVRKTLTQSFNQFSIADCSQLLSPASELCYTSPLIDLVYLEAVITVCKRSTTSQAGLRDRETRAEYMLLSECIMAW